MDVILLGFLWLCSLVLSTSFIAFYVRKVQKPDAITAIYVIYIALSQILATKIVEMGPFYVPAAVLIFPFTFQLTDTMNEHFGKKETHRMILIAFITQVLMVIFLFFSTELNPAPFWGIDNTQWIAIFGQTFSITAASWISYLITENLDAILFAKIRQLTKERYLWVRSILSDIPMLALDSVIFITLAFGVFAVSPDWGFIGELIIGQMITKWIFGVIDTPFIYLDRYIVGSKNVTVN